MSYVDSKAIFRQRCLAVGLPTEVVDRLDFRGWSTFANFAHAPTATPGTAGAEVAIKFLMRFWAIRSLLTRLLSAVCTGRPGPSQLQTLSGKWTERMKRGRENCLLLRLELACKCSLPRSRP